MKNRFYNTRTETLMMFVDYENDLEWQRDKYFRVLCKQFPWLLKRRLLLKRICKLFNNAKTNDHIKQVYEVAKWQFSIGGDLDYCYIKEEIGK